MRVTVNRRRSGNRILGGAIAGLIGTVTMTVPILVSRRLGMIPTPPPVEITARVAERLPAPVPRRQAFTLLWVSSHAGYGVACGIAYALTRRYLPRSTAAAGVLFGLAVWGVSYLGIVPSLGLYPRPADDSRPRLAVMVVAHTVFGLTVAWVCRRLAHGRR